MWVAAAKAIATTECTGEIELSLGGRRDLRVREVGTREGACATPVDDQSACYQMVSLILSTHS